MLFPTKKDVFPKIYAYVDSSFPNQIKVGYTTRSVLERVKEQHPILTPVQTWRIVFEASAMRDDGTTFKDYEIHNYLKKKGYKNSSGEWFVCDLDAVKSAYIAVKNRNQNVQNRTQDFLMRKEQEEAVLKTLAYYEKIDNEANHRIPHFLWNAKMRFGKTFSAYQLAKAMNCKRVLVLTFKPAVEDAWQEDLNTHIDFEGWQFVSPTGLKFSECDKKRPIVCFGSFQDYLGKNENGGIKTKNEWVHATNWDLIIFDEYHFGAWNENVKKLADSSDELDKLLLEEQKNILKEEGYSSLMEEFSEDNMPITGYHYLYMSGTPFKAIASGEFTEDQIFNWTYSDEQEAKKNYVGEPNPYLELPQIIMMTYQLPSSVTNIITDYGKDEFDLNEFFKAQKNAITGKFVFVHEEAVQKWLDMIRGAEKIAGTNDPDATNPPLPFSDIRLLNLCNHTMWFLPFVSSCDAMEELLKLPHNNFYHNYKVINCSGASVGTGIDAIEPVRKAMGDNPVESKTIILTCGKLTTGVTIRPLGGILMLRNSSSPETYFQSAFRIQSPWTTFDENERKKIILKENCYIFDFAPNRALSQVVEYADKLNVSSSKTSVQKVNDFINFLPILQYDGATMKQVTASEILDFVSSGTSATLLARRWQSALLVNVDNNTLNNIINNKEVFNAIMKIEGFRSLGKDIFKKIVNKSEKIKKLKNTDKPLTKKEKKELTDEEKEYKSLRKQVQEKLVKFATRIPIFMYLTDYREESLVDIIRKVAPKLFEKVTGLTINDFELLLSYNVFNSERMNSSILQFRRYEDASLSYTGIMRHNEKQIGLFDTTVSHEVIKEVK